MYLVHKRLIYLPRVDSRVWKGSNLCYPGMVVRAVVPTHPKEHHDRNQPQRERNTPTAFVHLSKMSMKNHERSKECLCLVENRFE